MDFLSRGHMLADVSAIIGSLDIVFGEIDRRWGLAPESIAAQEIDHQPTEGKRSWPDAINAGMTMIRRSK
jgi:hypothetical protein